MKMEQFGIFFFKISFWIIKFENERPLYVFLPLWVTACIDAHVDQVRALIENERRGTCTEVAEQLADVSKSSVHRILTQHFGMRKVSARWVPHDLTENQKAERLEISRELLQQHQQEEDSFLDRTVAIDETWIRSYEPELKRQSAEWHRLGSPRPIKFCQKPSSLVSETYAHFYQRYLGNHLVTLCATWGNYGCCLLLQQPQSASSTGNQEKEARFERSIDFAWQCCCSLGSYDSRNYPALGMENASSTSLQPWP